MSTEVTELLKHPDPRERALALSLDSITGQDVACAILDPNPLVWKKAFYHSNSSHALSVLAANSRDASGSPLTERHDLLLNDPRRNQEHVDNIYRSVQNDGHLPIDQQAGRLSVLRLRQPLMKKEDSNQIRLNHTPDPLQKIVNVSQEESRHPELLKAYNESVNSNSPIAPTDSDLHQVGTGSPKVVYKTNDHKWIVKPYLEEEHPHSGWNEATSQELYHSAEIPHLHQKSFVASYNNGNEHIPATVIHIEESKPLHKVPKQEILANNPGAPEDARKIATMDFLTGNSDRHTNNLLVKSNGQLLAIDHGLAFTYNGKGNVQGEFDYDNPEHLKEYIPQIQNSTHLGRYDRKAPSLLTREADPKEPFGHLSNDLDY